jgi:hypothetical protein
MFMPDPECRVKKIPDPGPHQRIEVVLTKKLFLSSRENDFGMFIPDPVFFLSRIQG